MLQRISFLLGALLLLSGCASQPRGGGFHSISQYLAADPAYAIYFKAHDINRLFDTPKAANVLSSANRVRLVRDIDLYSKLRGKEALAGQLRGHASVVELPETDLRPALTELANFENYGDQTMCEFEPGVAILIGGEEPHHAILCCFKCHDIRIIRRPTPSRPTPHVVTVGMSPELERLLFDLTRRSCPADPELRRFKIRNRKRATQPPESQSGSLNAGSKDPFATSRVVSGTAKTRHKSPE